MEQETQKVWNVKVTEKIQGSEAVNSKLLEMIGKKVQVIKNWGESGQRVSMCFEGKLKELIPGEYWISKTRKGGLHGFVVSWHHGQVEDICKMSDGRTVVSLGRDNKHLKLVEGV